MENDRVYVLVEIDKSVFGRHDDVPPPDLVTEGLLTQLSEDQFRTADVTDAIHHHERSGGRYINGQRIWAFDE